MTKPKPNGVERQFKEGEVIISKTDLKGKILYGNKIFIELSGYTERELWANLIISSDTQICLKLFLNFYGIIFNPGKRLWRMLKISRKMVRIIGSKLSLLPHLIKKEKL